MEAVGRVQLRKRRRSGRLEGSGTSGHAARDIQVVEAGMIIITLNTEKLEWRSPEESVLKKYRQSDSTANVARQLRGQTGMRVSERFVMVAAPGPCEMTTTATIYVNMEEVHR
ncbi:hypothetical protein CY34DRAFT_506011 [Suillus luteus UH-Slu-Lm8-n1]|uniref:Uncharacterized protein n=1 Tax=Suillus luteus UH-Slu-Lm8-n1 TaxID=930992 RepID=A0A0D0AEQ7_9AGAM|nr:hypothetical protein CY34DRAFT_506011 [Suillus luteus UH-Slu-Lm8-n1]